MQNEKDMKGIIKEFYEAHQAGWNHEEWLGLLDQLAGLGHDVSNPDSIGLGLERERVEASVRGLGIRGLGPRRIEAIADQFASLEALRAAGPEDIKGRTGIPAKIAGEIARLLV